MIPCLFLNPRNGKETPENFHSIFCNACHHRKYHHRIALCKSPNQTGSVTERREKKEKDVFCPCGKIIYLFTENYATIATSQTTNNKFSPVHFERTTLFISHSSYKAEKADSVFYKACHTFLFHSLFIGPRPSHFLFFFFSFFTFIPPIFDEPLDWMRYGFQWGGTSGHLGFPVICKGIILAKNTYRQTQLAHFSTKVKAFSLTLDCCC